MNDVNEVQLKFVRDYEFNEPDIHKKLKLIMLLEIVMIIFFAQLYIDVYMIIKLQTLEELR